MQGIGTLWKTTVAEIFFFGSCSFYIGFLMAALSIFQFIFALLARLDFPNWLTP